MTSSIVRFRGIKKTYHGAQPAIPGLDLDIEEGSFVTLLGPSGCGKSTTLRLLGGFEQADAGQIFLAEEDITGLPPERRDVNMVFQDYALFSHLDVAANVGFGLQMKGMPKAQIASRVNELLDLVGLSDFAKRKPAALSGGQRQRVALARALAPNPKVLLLDEPLAALDAKLRVQMQTELKSIQRRSGKTFLFVTHDQEEALALSDRIIVMEKGRIAQSGTPQELYYQPASRFVADFIGASAQVRARVSALSSEAIHFEASGLRVQGAARGKAPDLGSDVTLYLRPEALRLTEASHAQGYGQLRGQTFGAGKLILDIALPDGAQLSLHHEPSLLVPPIGSTVHFAVSPENLIYFPN